MAGNVKAKSIFTTTGWLSQTPASFQRDVLSRCVRRKIKADEPIYPWGSAPDGLFGIVSGSLAFEIAPAERGPYLAYFLRPGAWFGGAPVRPGPRVAGLRATRASELLHLPVSAMNIIVEKDLTAWRYFAEVSLVHLRNAICVCDDLMIRNHVRRFVAMLLHAAGCRLSTPPDSEPIEVDALQDQLANMSNVARTTAGPILRRLAREGLIDISYRRIRVRNPDALRAMLI